MEETRKEQIYDRLLAISFSLETEPILDPRYLNEKFGELHAYIEEIGQFAIQVNKELSVYQRNLNNAQAIYDAEKERLLTEDGDIVDLPNIRDREAKANSKLKQELQEIREMQDEVTDLNNLSKSINLKLRNLSRANTDIRMQVRIMESQIKIGTYKGDPVHTRGIQEEMRRSIEGTDSFQDAETSVEQEQTVDPSENIVEDLFEDTPEEQSQEEEEQNQDDTEEGEENSEEISESMIEPFSEPGIEPPEIIEEEVEEAISSESMPIDLDSIIDTEDKESEENLEPTTEEPEATENPEPAPESEPAEDEGEKTGGDDSSAQQEDSQKSQQETDAGSKSDKIDVDDLLAQYS